MPENTRFAQLVGLACHDLRTPLATVSGFAKTLARNDLAPPTDRYVAMIEEASLQLRDLLDELGLLARIEAGRFDPAVVDADSLDLAKAAAAELDAGRVDVDGLGALVRVPQDEIVHALSQLGRAATRHGGFETVALSVDGATLTFAPVTEYSGPVLLGEELRDLGAAAASTLIRALGGSVDVEGERLLVRLPA